MRVKQRGYCGIGVVNMKTKVNYGTLYRSAYCFGADFIFLIGRRFKKQSSDTVKAFKHIPLYEYSSVDDFIDHIPYDCRLVGVEITNKSKPLHIVTHPERAIYVLGAEDGGLPQQIIDHCYFVAEIPTRYCLNVAVAGSIVLYDRQLKRQEL